MKNNKIMILSRTRSFRSSAAFILTVLMLVVAATTTVATAQTYTDLYNFGGLAPWFGVLTQGRDGNLYGTTPSGATTNFLGVVFKLTPRGTLKVLHHFNGFDGRSPYSGLTLGTDGNFYGTTAYGGSANCEQGCGTIFKITNSGNLTTLHSFTGGADGSNPWAPPIQGSDGSFYGATFAGTVYKITSSGAFTSLGSLPGGSYAPLLQGTDGNFYGTTDWGGPNDCHDGYDGCGTFFKVTPKGIVTTLHNFDGTHGQEPARGIIQGSDGNFYGTTAGGGINGGGVAFKLTPQGAITVLHNFPDPDYPNDGRDVYAGLVQATDGNFYGVTFYGGSAGDGIVFKMSPGGAYSILYNFDGYNFDGTHGANPISTPIQHTNGKIFGLTNKGGTYNKGVVYSLDVGLGSFVRSVPTSGKVGNVVVILGGALTGTSSVSFNGTPATFKVWSDTYLRATVPSGATTGVVTVTTSTGTLTSNPQFRVTPVVKTFSPTSGPVGTPVTIMGNSLTQTAKVAFGGVKATTFSVDSDTQVTATVPTGAVTGHIAITTASGWTWSPGIFTVTQ
jgi:uncharacterized repeat protein (TIGR03803 family)